jgi:hypothetical protein
MDKGVGAGEGGAGGGSGIRLCNLVAQGKGDAEGAVQAGSGDGANWAGDGATRDHLLQDLQSQIPVIEQALEAAALMLGTDKSRGYCLEMICADFLGGANLDNENPEILLQTIRRFFEFLPGEQKHAFLEQTNERAS